MADIIQLAAIEEIQNLGYDNSRDRTLVRENIKRIEAENETEQQRDKTHGIEDCNRALDAAGLSHLKLPTKS
jgi:hypothetical protein